MSHFSSRLRILFLRHSQEAKAHHSLRLSHICQSIHRHQLSKQSSSGGEREGGGVWDILNKAMKTYFCCQLGTIPLGISSQRQLGKKMSGIANRLKGENRKIPDSS